MRAYIKHRSRGRLRLRIPQVKGQPKAMQRLAECARRISGVKSAEANPVTGSILLTLAADAVLDASKLSEALSSPDWSIEVIELASHALQPRVFAGGSEGTEAIAEFMEGADEAIRRATHNKLDLNLLLPLAAAAGAVGMLGKTSSSTPLWATLMIFAFSSFAALQSLPATHRRHEEAPSEVKYLH